MERTARERSIMLQSCIEMFLFIFTRKALKLKSPLQTLLIEGYIIIAHLSISSTKKKKSVSQRALIGPSFVLSKLRYNSAISF